MGESPFFPEGSLGTNGRRMCTPLLLPLLAIKSKQHARAFGIQSLCSLSGQTQPNIMFKKNNASLSFLPHFNPGFLTQTMSRKVMTTHLNRYNNTTPTWNWLNPSRYIFFFSLTVCAGHLSPDTAGRGPRLD